MALARSCDVADPAACAALVDAATAFLEPHGGIDTVMYAAGTAPLGPLSDTTADQWHELLATNVVGAALVLARALPSLRRHPGWATAVLLSSHSVGDPWPGLVPYAASKAALNELALGLRSEEPALRTIRVAVGPTSTSFADGWDPETATGFLGGWAERGYLRHTILEPAETAAMILAALDDPDAPDDLSVIGAEAQ
jgi:NAD(P)-dependent dehydrogenase (short-subunit alcohol dehydrogenase family)